MWNGILIIAAFLLIITSMADLDIVASAPTSNAGISGDMSVLVLDTAGDPAKGLQVVVNKKIETFNLKVKDVSVPEFPTVALPVAVIMGLVFFFHRRQG